MLDKETKKIIVYDGFFETGDEKLCFWQYHIKGLFGMVCGTVNNFKDYEIVNAMWLGE
jgi:hypothetical protein